MRKKSCSRVGTLAGKRFKQAIREKHRLFRTYKQNPIPHGWNMFKQQRNKVTSMLWTAKSDFIFILLHLLLMNTGTAKPVTLPVMENQLQLDHNHTTCHVYTNFSQFSPRASRRSHHPCLMIPAAWWKRKSTKPKSSMLFLSDRLPSRHSMENLHQSMQRLLQRTANYLCPSQFLPRMWSVPYVR